MNTTRWHAEGAIAQVERARERDLEFAQYVEALEEDGARFFRGLLCGLVLALAFWASGVGILVWALRGARRG